MKLFHYVTPLIASGACLALAGCSSNKIPVSQNFAIVGTEPYQRYLPWSQPLSPEVITNEEEDDKQFISLPLKLKSDQYDILAVVDIRGMTAPFPTESEALSMLRRGTAPYELYFTRDAQNWLRLGSSTTSFFNFSFGIEDDFTKWLSDQYGYNRTNRDQINLWLDRTFPNSKRHYSSDKSLDSIIRNVRVDELFRDRPIRNLSYSPPYINSK